MIIMLITIIMIVPNLGGASRKGNALLLALRLVTALALDTDVLNPYAT